MQIANAALLRCCVCCGMCTLILLVNQVYYYLHHHILLLRLALCNHQRQSHEGVVCKTLAAILTIEYSVIVQEPQKESGSYAFIAIAKRVILRHQIQQHCSFFLHTGIEFIAPKRLS